MDKLPAFRHLHVLSECWLLSWGFTVSECLPSVSNSLGTSTVDVYWIFSVAVCASFESVLWFLSSVLFIWPITCTDLHVLSNCSYIPGANCTGSRPMVLLLCCWSPFASTALRVFPSVLTRNIGLQFSLPVVHRAGECWPLEMNWNVFPTLEIFERIWGLHVVINLNDIFFRSWGDGIQ